MYESEHQEGDRCRSRKAVDDPYRKGSQPLVEREPAEPRIQPGQRRLVFAVTMFISAALRMTMDVVAMSVDMVTQVWRSPPRLVNEACLTDHAAHARQGQHPEKNEHDADAELHGEAKAGRYDDAEQYDRAADDKDCQSVTDPPCRTDHRRTSQIALTADDRGDGDDVVRIGGVSNPEQKSQKEQRRQV